MSQYPPTEYHARLKWEQERAGKVIITPGTPYPPTEYHERQKLEKHFKKKQVQGRKKGWW
jgi:hypothetical protein